MTYLTTRARRATCRRRQRGVALVLVLSVMSVLLLAGMIGVGLLLASLRTTTQDVSSKRALSCAEAGLAVGKSYFAANYNLWDSYLACNLAANCSSSSYPLTGYSDAVNGRGGYSVRIIDNLDETGTQDPAHDNDLTVIVESRCTDPLLPPRVVQQYVGLRSSTTGSRYRQAGGWNGTNQQQ